MALHPPDLSALGEQAQAETIVTHLRYTAQIDSLGMAGIALRFVGFDGTAHQYNMPKHMARNIADAISKAAGKPVDL